MLVVVKANILATRRADLEGERLEFMAVELKRANICRFYFIVSLTLILHLSPWLSYVPLCKMSWSVPDLDWSCDQSAPFNTGGRVDHNTFCELMGGNYLQ